ncbi:hypothetical protein HOLleu_32946 [Holothuria leucospilota]|uniref:Uncharacterized protein n=1 Tax=Holothuria leucospilota TaxID=206669 RepID=A0A9Q1BG89_HOLLE|nr:hypothetical protein HOLleu_32946 [Holothuria leucospilota]
MTVLHISLNEKFTCSVQGAHREAINMVCSNATVTHEMDGSITVSLPSQLDTIVTSLQDSLQHEHLCDVTIHLDNHHFSAHKFLLVSISKYFRRLFFTYTKEHVADITNSTELSAKSFEQFLRFAYSSKLKLESLDDVKEMLQLARILEAGSIKEACREYLRGKLTGDNCTEILSVAEENQLEELEKQAKKLMNKRLMELSETYKKKSLADNNCRKEKGDANQEYVEVDVDDSSLLVHTEKTPTNPDIKGSKSSVVPSSARPGTALQVETKAALKRFPILRPRRSRKPALPIQIISSSDSPQAKRQKVQPVTIKGSTSKQRPSQTKQRDCKLCGKTFPSPKALREHSQLEHVRCGKCRKLFISKTHLRNHLVFHNKKGLKQGTKKNYECSYCGKKCNYASALKVHIRTHTGQKPFVCSFCNQSFIQSINLTRHVLSYHDPDTPKYQCKDCGKRFSVQIYLKSHEITHSMERPFQCEECGALFKRKNDLRSHRRVHSTEKPHQCQLCMSCFKTVGDLKTHMQIHNSNKPHRCGQCGKEFKRKGHLNRHIKTHTNEKPFKCEKCHASFNRKENLRNHMRTHTGDYPYKCEQCGSQFKHSSSLKAHSKKHWSHTTSNPKLFFVQSTGFQQPEEPPQQLPSLFQTSSNKMPPILTIQSQEQANIETSATVFPSTTQANLTSFGGPKFLCLQNYHPAKSNVSTSTSQTLIPLAEIGMYSETGETVISSQDGSSSTTGLQALPVQVFTVPKPDGSDTEGNSLQAVIVNPQQTGEFILGK